MRDDVPAGDTVEQRRPVDPDDLGVGASADGYAEIDAEIDPTDDEAQSALPDGSVPETMEADPADVAEHRRITPIDDEDR